MKSSHHLSKEESYPYVAPYQPLINSLIADAVDSYKRKPPEDRLIDSSRTRSSSISDRILWNIGHCEQLLKDPYVKIRRRYGVVRILIKDTVQVIFKKLDGNLKPSHPSTIRSLNYSLHCDDVHKEFPEIENAELRPTNLYWGYIWDLLGETRTPIVCMDGSQIDWYIETITKVAEPIMNTEQQQNRTTKKVRPKYVQRKSNT
jgi:hypothetical protein